MIQRRFLLIGAMAVAAQLGSAQVAERVEGKNIRVEFDRSMHSRVVALFDGREEVIGDFTPSETIQVAGVDVKDFTMQGSKSDAGGSHQIWGTAGSLRKEVRIGIEQDFPRVAFF
jgi:hypothetical protein